jgi:hypothetical protein
MNLEKYPNISKYFNSIENKEKFLENIKNIKESDELNTILITDYNVTTKISCYYLNHNIPLSRNTNTISIKTNYASYIYYLTIYLLISLNNNQYYSHGEFIISFDTMVELVEELNTFVHNVIEKYKLDDTLNNIIQSLKDLINTEKIEKIEKIEDIYDEKGLFSDQIVPDINNNVVKTLVNIKN